MKFLFFHFGDKEKILSFQEHIDLNAPNHTVEKQDEGVSIVLTPDDVDVKKILEHPDVRQVE